MKKIVRITRHAVTQAQINELKRIFGEVEIVEVNETLPADPKEAVARFDQIVTGAHVAEVVLPIGLLEAILKFSQFVRNGGVVIRAVMDRRLEGDKAVFEFRAYERVVKVEVVTEAL